MKQAKNTSITFNAHHALGVAIWSVACLLLLSACGDGDTPGTTPPKGGAPSAANESTPPPASDLPEKTIEITGNDLMKFDIERMEAGPGQKVTVVFTNVGTMPKVSMGHNWVLLKPNTNVLEFLEPGFIHAARDYIAPEVENRILARTKILGPGESESVTFTAPAAGEYEYICTFPGHWAAGMKGTFIVQ